jgi:hypothetical protein
MLKHLWPALLILFVAAGCGAPGTDDPASMAEYMVQMLDKGDAVDAYNYYVGNHWDAKKKRPLNDEEKARAAEKFTKAHDESGLKDARCIFKGAKAQGKDKVKISYEFRPLGGNKRIQTGLMVKRQNRWWFSD